MPRTQIPGPVDKAPLLGTCAACGRQLPLGSEELHDFPNAPLCHAWARVLGVKLSELEKDKLFVCGDHFEQRDFLVSVRDRDQNAVRITKKLDYAFAVPTKNLGMGSKAPNIYETAALNKSAVHMVRVGGLRQLPMIIRRHTSPQAKGRKRSVEPIIDVSAIRELYKPQTPSPRPSSVDAFSTPGSSTSSCSTSMTPPSAKTMRMLNIVNNGDDQIITVTTEKPFVPDLNIIGKLPPLKLSPPQPGSATASLLRPGAGRGMRTQYPLLCVQSDASKRRTDTESYTTVPPGSGWNRASSGQRGRGKVISIIRKPNSTRIPVQAAEEFALSSGAEEIVLPTISSVHSVEDHDEEMREQEIKQEEMDEEIKAEIKQDIKEEVLDEEPSMEFNFDEESNEILPLEPEVDITIQEGPFQQSYPGFQPEPPPRDLIDDLSNQSHDDLLKENMKFMSTDSPGFFLVSRESLLELFTRCRLCAGLSYPEVHQMGLGCSVKIVCARGHVIKWRSHKQDPKAAATAGDGSEQLWPALYFCFVAQLLGVCKAKLGAFLSSIFRHHSIDDWLPTVVSKVSGTSMLYNLTSSLKWKQLPQSLLCTIVCKQLLLVLNPITKMPVAYVNNPNISEWSVEGVRRLLTTAVTRFSLMGVRGIKQVELLLPECLQMETDWKPLLVSQTTGLTAYTLRVLKDVLPKGITASLGASPAVLALLLDEIVGLLLSFYPGYLDLPEDQGREKMKNLLQEIRMLSENSFRGDVRLLELHFGEHAKISLLVDPKHSVTVGILMSYIEDRDMYSLLKDSFGQFKVQHTVDVKVSDRCIKTAEAMRMVDLIQDEPYSAMQAVKVVLMLQRHSEGFSLVKVLKDIRIYNTTITF